MSQSYTAANVAPPSSQINVTEKIAGTIAVNLLPNLPVIASLNTDRYVDEMGDRDDQIGDTIGITLPAVAQAGFGMGFQPGELNQGKVVIALSYFPRVHYSFAEATNQYYLGNLLLTKVIPAMLAIATLCETVVIDGLLNVATLVVGNSSIAINLTGVAYLPARLMNAGFPDAGNNTFCAINPIDMATLVGTTYVIFNPQTKISRIIDDGYLSDIAGVRFAVSPLIQPHVYGLQGGTPVVSGAGQTGSTITVSGFTPNTVVLNRADIFKIQGVFSMLPQNAGPSNTLQAFNVQSTVTSNGSGVAVIPIVPYITVGGTNPTVSAAPANGAAIMVNAPSGAVVSRALFYHPAGAAVQFGTLGMPEGANVAVGVSLPMVGGRIRYTNTWFYNNASWNDRFDALFGWVPIYVQAIGIWEFASASGS